ncbi:MAG: hypothetical protein KAJ19_25460 [Gammaproteobacteria bacterium]|nr:hypothetical protein [Gammaproteobacteria bacterium]
MRWDEISKQEVWGSLLRFMDRVLSAGQHTEQLVDEMRKELDEEHKRVNGLLERVTQLEAGKQDKVIRLREPIPGE